MLEVLSPVPGTATGLSGVPDPVFSQGMVGPGTAVDPERAPQTAVAPIAGTIVKLHPHAFVIAGADGKGVLVHLGIDTVDLKGEGFETLAAEGDTVEAGAPLVRWDPAEVEQGGRSPAVPVVALDAPKDTVLDTVESGAVEAGATALFAWR
ncbi:PTS sugar transporter subunit IIA [Nocardiopsis suaedae]|uniref:PTS glucose transporter subunit IIA n=1 Tax=Nocardiopsis suaedae TaxID=3018444 RepID=A0ABT4TNS4_9ACTN|nr:PTS glucose transporter subunit IIA [Nocardiopsis suaedae]MDA2806016.1 PTS glucose transporter subunit IIA [Nocardiopsis suaedae]